MGYRVSIIGITGAVGQKMLEILEDNPFEIDRLDLYASERSKKRAFMFNDKKIPVKTFTDDIDDDIVFLAVDDALSRKMVPTLQKRTLKIIDNSSAFRLDRDVPLVIPSINGHTIEKKQRIISNPNCSTIELLIALKHFVKYGIKKLIVTTFQSVSGAGLKAILTLSEESEKFIKGEDFEPKFYPHPIAFNILPFIGVFDKEGKCSEEVKMVKESHKILNDDTFEMYVTTTRVPVFYSHLESVYMETKRDLDLKKIFSDIKKDPEIRILDNADGHIFPMPISSKGTDTVDIGRIRKEGPNKAQMIICADNLRVGAATNAVNIAEHIIKKGLL